MNYRFQLTGIDTACDGTGNGVTGYSTGNRPPLDEGGLAEAAGICGAFAKDWNLNLVIDPGLVAADINNFSSQGFVLETNQAANCQGTFTVLTDFDDWAAIQPHLVSSVGGGGASLQIASPPLCPSPGIGIPHENTPCGPLLLAPV